MIDPILMTDPEMIDEIKNMPEQASPYELLSNLNLEKSKTYYNISIKLILNKSFNKRVA